MLDVMDTLIKSVDDGKVSVLILLGYTKAFDMLNHFILLAILLYIGFFFWKTYKILFGR